MSEKIEFAHSAPGAEMMAECGFATAGDAVVAARAYYGGDPWEVWRMDRVRPKGKAALENLLEQVDMSISDDAPWVDESIIGPVDERTTIWAEETLMRILDEYMDWPLGAVDLVESSAQLSLDMDPKAESEEVSDE